MSDEGNQQLRNTAPASLAPVSGVDAAEWNALVLHGTTSGLVHADSVLHVLRHVELTAEVLEILHEDLHLRGIQIDNTIEELHDDDAQLRRTQRAARMAGMRDTSTPSDPVRMYLKEIGRVGLLNGQDERRLAQSILDGVAASERLIAEASTLSEVERRRLERAVRAGESAKSELTQANLRLVVSIAKRYQGREMALLDLIQEGNLGLMRAVEKFDHTKGFKFSTYATWWIRQAITRAIADQSRTIRIPVHMVEHINRVHKAQRELLQELKREPTLSELSAHCGMPEDRLQDILRISQDTKSLDAPVGDSDDASFGDLLADDRLRDPSEAALDDVLKTMVESVLAELGEREQEVVRMRFGLDDGQARTLDEVGKALGVTRERIRQIEAKTLNKLRQGRYREQLESFVGEG